MADKHPRLSRYVPWYVPLVCSAGQCPEILVEPRCAGVVLSLGKA